MTTISRITPVNPRSTPSPRDPYQAHELAWKFYSRGASQERDFVYRYDPGPSGATLLAVAEHEPAPLEGWRVESKPYDVDVEAGDVLSFALRANPTSRDHSTGSDNNRRHDVVMIEKRKRRAAEELYRETEVVQEACSRWLAARAERHGFHVEPEGVLAQGYEPLAFQRPRDRQALAITSVDFVGRLRVLDPDLFRDALRRGVGPAKSFGFGLLLVKRP